MTTFLKVLVVCSMGLSSVVFAQETPLLRCDLVDLPTGHISEAGVIVSISNPSLLMAGQAPIANNDPTKFWVVAVDGANATSIYYLNKNTRSFSIFNGYFALDYTNCTAL